MCCATDNAPAGAGLVGKLARQTPRCLECHFQIEEQAAFALLPVELAEELAAEHALFREQIALGRLDADRLTHHAAVEDEAFRMWVSKPLADSLIADHKAYARQLAAGVSFGQASPVTPSLAPRFWYYFLWDEQCVHYTPPAACEWVYSDVFTPGFDEATMAGIDEGLLTAYPAYLRLARGLFDHSTGQYVTWIYPVRPAPAVPVPEAPSFFAQMAWALQQRFEDPAAPAMPAPFTPWFAQ